VAGLGTQNQKSVSPLVRRAQLRSTYNFVCLLYAKWSTRNRNGPHVVSRSPPEIHRNTLLRPLGGSGDVTPQYKNQAKGPTFLCVVLFWAFAMGVVAAATFYTYFYNHARRLRLEKLLYLGLSRSLSGYFKPLRDPGGGSTSETAARQFQK
jgi:hypothetical protein